MTHTELNALPHRTLAELDAIPSVTLIATAGMPKWLIGTRTRVFAPVETAEGWTGCVRVPPTGDFYTRQLYPRTNYTPAT